MFDQVVTDGVTPLQWWISQRNAVGREVVQLAEQLLTARASSAGVELLFSLSVWLIAT